MEQNEKATLDAKQRHLAKLKKQLLKQERKLEKSLRVSQAKEHVRKKLKEQALIQAAENQSLLNENLSFDSGDDQSFNDSCLSPFSSKHGNDTVVDLSTGDISLSNINQGDRTPLDETSETTTPRKSKESASFMEDESGRRKMKSKDEAKKSRSSFSRISTPIQKSSCKGSPIQRQLSLLAAKTLFTTESPRSRSADQRLKTQSPFNQKRSSSIQKPSSTNQKPSPINYKTPSNQRTVETNLKQKPSSNQKSTAHQDSHVNQSTSPPNQKTSPSNRKSNQNTSLSNQTPSATNQKTSPSNQKSRLDDSGISQSSLEISRTSFLNDSLSLTPTFGDDVSEKSRREVNKPQSENNLQDPKQTLHFQASEINKRACETELQNQKQTLHCQSMEIDFSGLETCDFLEKVQNKNSAKSINEVSNYDTIQFISQTKLTSKSKVKDPDHLTIVNFQHQTSKTKVKVAEPLQSASENSFDSRSKSQSFAIPGLKSAQTNDFDSNSDKISEEAFPNDKDEDLKVSQEDLNFGTMEGINSDLPILIIDRKSKRRSRSRRKPRRQTSSPTSQKEEARSIKISNSGAKRQSEVDKHKRTSRIEMHLKDKEGEITEVSESDSQKSISILVDTSKSVSSSLILDERISVIESGDDDLTTLVSPISDEHSSQSILKSSKKQDFKDSVRGNNCYRKSTRNSTACQNTDRNSCSNVSSQNPGNSSSQDKNSSQNSNFSDSLSLKRRKFKQRKRSLSHRKDGSESLASSQESKRIKVSETSSRSSRRRNKNNSRSSQESNKCKIFEKHHNSNSQNSSLSNNSKTLKHWEMSTTSKKETLDSKQNSEMSQFSEFTELDIVEFSQFKFSEEFLTEGSENSERGRKRKRHPSHLGMIVQRRSPRVASLIDSESSSNSYSENSRRRQTKKEKCLIISSVFQYLVDETKRESEICEFILPDSQFKHLMEVKLLENNFELDNNSSVISAAKSATCVEKVKTPKCNNNLKVEDSERDVKSMTDIDVIYDPKPIDENFMDSVEDSTSSKPRYENLTTDLEKDIKVIYDSEPIPDDSMSEEQCYHRNDATDLQENDLSTISEKFSKENLDIIDNFEEKGNKILEDIEKKTENEEKENLESAVQGDKLDSTKSLESPALQADPTEICQENFDDFEVTFKNNIQLSISTPKFSSKIKSRHTKNLFKNPTSTPKCANLSETPKTPNLDDLASSTPKINANFVNSVLNVESFETPKAEPSKFTENLDAYTTPKDANIRRHFNFADDNLSPPLFPTQKDLTPIGIRRLEDETLDSFIQLDNAETECDEVIGPVDCIKLCREESVVFISGGTWTSEGHEYSYIVCLLPSAISVWSQGQGQWGNELDWYLSQTYQAIEGWIIKKANKVVLIILEEDKTGDQRVSLFYYDLLSGDSNMSIIDLSINETNPVTSLLCCIINKDQLIIGYNHCTSLTATKHVLIDGYKQMSLCCHLESTSGYLMDLAEVRHLECCVVGLTSKREALIWNHEVGFLIKKIDLDSVITPGVSLTAVHNIQGYLVCHLLYRVKSDSPGYVVIVNITNNSSLILHDYQSLQFSWKGLKNVAICGDSILASDIHGNTGLWDMISGELLADIPRSKVTSGNINQSDQSLYLGLDGGAVLVYSIENINLKS